MSSLRFGVLGALAIAAASMAGNHAQATSVTTGDISVTLTNVNLTTIFLDDATGVLTSTGHVGSQAGDPGTPVITFVTDQLADFASGTATIKSSSNSALYTSITVSVPTNWSFTQLAFSTLKGNDVTFTGKSGATTVGTYTDDNVGNGDTKWLMEAINGKSFTSIIIGAVDGFDQTKQYEIGIAGLVYIDPNCTGPNCGPNPGPGEAPIPGAAFLMGSVIATGAGFGAWRRRRRVAA
jgi:hypothetical protein